MKLIIAGSRHLDTSAEFIFSALKMFDINAHTDLSEVISGNALGVDYRGEEFGEIIGCVVKRFKADWDTHGKAAGPIRNRQMAEYGDALLLIWDGESRGSKSMLDEAKKRNLKIYEVILKGVKNGN